jgi:hypothetical protein
MNQKKQTKNHLFIQKVYMGGARNNKGQKE